MTISNNGYGYNKVIDGVGKDAIIVENANGGKQSDSPMAMHLLDPEWLRETYPLEGAGYGVFRNITDFMETLGKEYIQFAMDIIEPSREQQIIRIARVLKEGASKYQANNWRLIPEEEHLNHAMIHLLAAEMGDTQDNHLDHALCRLMMVYATERSYDFDYNSYLG